MTIWDTNDHWREQHNDWRARRERQRADRADRKVRRDHGLRRRQAAKLDQSTKKAANPGEPEMAA